LFQGIGVEVLRLKTTRLMHDRVEGLGRSQSKVAMESSESYVTLISERGETEFHVEETGG
jgi:hypothetical protein